MTTIIVTSASVLIAAFALGVGLWHGRLTRRQVSHAERLSRAQLYQTITRLFIEVDVFFVDHPDLRPYFYRGVPLPPSPPERDRVLAAAEMFADLAECCTAAKVVLGEFAGDWDKYLERLHVNSPALREYWSEFGRYYPARVWRSFGVSESYM